MKLQLTPGHASGSFKDAGDRGVLQEYLGRLLSSAWAMLVRYCFISGPVEDQRDLTRGRARGRLLECITSPEVCSSG